MKKWSDFMGWKIIRRKFTAFKYPKGSPERRKLNKSSITSEFARKNIWLVVDDKYKPLKSFDTIEKCKDFIKFPEKYKPKTKIKKYTRNAFLNSQEFFNKKKQYLKSELKRGWLIWDIKNII